MESVALKRCLCCSNERPLARFGIDRHRPDGLNPYCKDCRRAKYEANREAHIAGVMRHYYANREAIQARRRTPEARAQSAARFRRWRREDPARWRAIDHKRAQTPRRQASKQANRLKNKARACEQHRAWKARHPGRWQMLNAKRTALRYARLVAGGPWFTTREWQALKTATGCRCLSCGLSETEPPLTADHVIPVKFGGSNDISNIQPLCRRCNSLKGVRDTDYRPAIWRHEASKAARR